ncbi:MAG: S41 family peptidase [Planctomycetia bacterium]|nr:S41 family peptidase [Planctomycetia bacterium]
MKTWLVLFFVFGFPWMLWADEAKASPKGSEEERFEDYRILIDTIHEIRQNYVGKVTQQELIDAAIEGVLKKLDPYSDYIPQRQMESFRKNMDSRFGGIGVQIAEENGRVVILSPLWNTPAYRADLFAGDVILEIDGKSLKGVSLDDASLWMKGEIGSQVRLRVQREGNPQPFEVTMEREFITMETVVGFDRNDDDSWNYWLDRANGVAYVQLLSFGQDTATQLREVIENLQKPEKEGEPSLRGLILDLRFNPGGILPVAIDVCDMFLNEGVIVSTKGRNTEEQVWRAKAEGTLAADLPLAVLINHFSASASEIVASCLQDNKRAFVVGERSWGKGSVQNVLELEGGSSALKLTTAGYFRPNGKNIHREEGATEEDEWGVIPEEGLLISMTPQQVAQLSQDQRRRQELRTHRKDVVSRGPSFDDPQLQKALDLVEKALKTDANTAVLLRQRLNLPVSRNTLEASRSSWQR